MLSVVKHYVQHTHTGKKMRTLDFYIEAAKFHSGIKSERQLCKMLRLSPTAITGYKKRNVLPTDETMVRLAKIAHLSPEQALLDLNMWRSQGQSKALYEKIAKILERSAVTAATISLLIFPAFNSNAAQVSHERTASIYYGKRRKLAFN